MTTELIARDAGTGQTVTLSMHPDEGRLALRWHGRSCQKITP